ncbi:flagellar biosynthetic protein FliP [Geodermatophilus normandii]|uniref:Flagellar biosynthetic protein FliP n=1 Tax=Geodermatophilus normandii TaxID=1137989 RepID=A0A317QK90_9ACTN|nr:hypothetical protein [Geodermatophilus normandii]PWW23187.1 flagellar biosynthetic protein FliP [Geodermatophilus normandii]
MTTTQRPRSRHTWHLVRHYLEMVVAMLVGMVVLGPVEDLLWPGLTARTDVHVLVMATNMAIGMAAWMRFRGHSWPAVAEMSAAMYVPFAVLLVPHWAGAVSGDLLMTAGHVLMLPAMALAVWWRLDEYAHH